MRKNNAVVILEVAGEYVDVAFVEVALETLGRGIHAVLVAWSRLAWDTDACGREMRATLAGPSQYLRSISSLFICQKTQNMPWNGTAVPLR